MASDKLTKNQKRRLKKKIEKQSAGDASANGASALDNNQQQPHESNTDDAAPPDVAVEYVSLDVKKELSLPENDPAYEEFLRIFGKFSSAEELCGQIPADDDVSVLVVCSVFRYTS